ncbi:hypothetical protein CERSUDRAFT_99594 [Gelatoporia subvermispora B]|uniref:Uncharacterized protein n=1 Tax=Ceriporiopsis subvermispora (strain B) TaxID=914234 RepID=M2P9Q5_CERS8|nr:hypothetical protein CERSUDRAFT_99594 [Gelatoporia subvermispora B]
MSSASPRPRSSTAAPAPLARLSRLVSAFPFGRPAPSPYPNPAPPEWSIHIHNHPYAQPQPLPQTAPPHQLAHQFSHSNVRAVYASASAAGGAGEHALSSSAPAAAASPAQVNAYRARPDRAGGIGDTPVPVRRSQEQSSHGHGHGHDHGLWHGHGQAQSTSQTQGQNQLPTQAPPQRASLVPRLSLPRLSRVLQHSASAATLKEKEKEKEREREREKERGTAAFPRPHPYAYAGAYTYTGPPAPQSAPPITSPSAPVPVPAPVHTSLSRAPAAPSSRAHPPAASPTSVPPSAFPAYAHTLPARAPTHARTVPPSPPAAGASHARKASGAPLALKASASTPDLRPRRDTSAGSSMRKVGRWLAADGWCAALVLPRPNFVLRVEGSDAGSATGVAAGRRLISPGTSPLLGPGEWEGRTSEAQGEGGEGEGEKAESVDGCRHGCRGRGQWDVDAIPAAGPSRLADVPGMLRAGRTEPGHSAGMLQVPEAGDSPAKGKGKEMEAKKARPRSFAWDDLALPSPVPSLSKVLEDGQQLVQERAAWNAAATKALFSQRARSVSRARARTITSPSPTPRALDRLAERTLLGSQALPPTIHVRPRKTSRADKEKDRDQAPPDVPLSPHSHSHSHSHSQSHARSHAHSNSVGTAASHAQTHTHTEESFMWPAGAPSGHGHRQGPGHARSHSLTASARKVVRTAAGFCGMGAEEELSTPTAAVAERAAAAAPATDPGVIQLAPPSAALAMLSPNQPMLTPSPVPSGAGTSAEGIGIAISSPQPSEDHSQRERARAEQEAFRIPAHPYAQGVYSAQTTTRPRAQTQDIAEGYNRHRQPVLVHPYSPYANQHSYGAAQTLTVRDEESLFAELTPGYIREFHAEELRYSPFGVRVEAKTGDQEEPQKQPERGHPYGPSTKRTSEWGFADALSHTLRRMGSADSGLGTSEDHEMPRVEDWEQSPPSQLAIQHDFLSSPPPESSLRPPVGQHGTSSNHTNASSNHTVASSPIEHFLPPSFRRIPSSGMLTGHSSASTSSPGMVSHDSSPPLSPRPINNAEDLDRFRNLFYRNQRTPDHSGSHTPEENLDSPNFSLSPLSSRPAASRQPSGGSIPIDIGPRSTRSVSGLTTLARQLSDEVEELRESELRWAQRFEAMSEPGGAHVLSPTSSGSGSSPSATSPLRLPLDHEMMLSQPTINVPEDIESSRASSVLDGPLHNEPIEVRHGFVEAVSTPPAFATPPRFSSHLSFIDYAAEQSPRHSAEQPTRVYSQQSSLGVPTSSSAARSSFMTTDTALSRMSGLSDFPIPPSQVTPEHTTLLNSYFADTPRSQPENPMDSLSVRPRMLLREPSQGTFGQQQVGEAL